MSGGAMQTKSDTLRPLKLMTVLNIIPLSIQGWTGDAVNLFATFPSGAVNGIPGLFPALASAGPGPLALWHGIEGLLVTLLSMGIALSALRRTRSRSVRVVSPLGLVFVVVAALGGYLFALSGFLNNGNSAQMGGAFIGAYVMNFLVLYYSKWLG